MVKRLLLRLAKSLPTPIVNRVGAAQFRYPFLAAFIRKLGGMIKDSEGVISSGAGKGLKINGKHGFPGYVLGTTEPDQQSWLSNNIRAGDVIYDVGANIGFFALICGKFAGKTGRVEAFEPNPVCAGACRYNISLNEFDHVSVHEVALSDTEGTFRFEFPDHSTALGRINNESLSRDGSQGIQVNTVRLDDYVAKEGLRPPTMLIIDVEGHEIEVLKGARFIIRNHLPLINCEVHWLGDTFLRYYTKELKPLGYTLRTIDGSEVPSEATRWQAVLTIERSKKYPNATESVI